MLDTETALDPATPLIHPELGDNLCFTRSLDTGGVDEAFARPDAVVFEETYVFGRHTGVTLEPRCQIADWNPGDQKLTVYHSFQAPHMMQDLYCRQFEPAGAAGARDLPRRRRQLRHQGARLPGRLRHRGARPAAAAGR